MARTCLLLSAFLLAYLLFFHRLADRELVGSHEARAAQNAQTILTTGRWGLPRLFDRKLELQKPPLYYWLVAAVARLRGAPVDAWAVRLPATAAGIGTTLLLFGLCWRRGRPAAGLVAAAVLATAVHYTWLARLGRIDMPLTLAVAAALTGFYLGECRRVEAAGRGAWLWLLPAYVAVAVALLLKGPIGAALPLAAAAAFLLVERQLPPPWHGRAWLRLLHDLGVWWGVPLVLLLALPWYAWANAQTDGALWRVFFWKHNLERGLGNGTLAVHPWWYYGPRLLADFLPWSLALPAAGWWLWRGGWRDDPEARFGLVWLFAMTALLSCFGFKRADYLAPAYPGAALLLSCWGQRLAERVAQPRRLATGFAAVVAGCAAGWWVYLGPLAADEGEADYRGFAAEVRRQAPPPALLLFFRTEAHALAFHVGPPIDTLLEWENLDVWAGRGPVYVVMPDDLAREWPRHLHAGQLEEVARGNVWAGDRHAQRLVLMRARPAPK